MNKTSLVVLLKNAFFNSLSAKVSEQYLIASPKLTIRSRDLKKHTTVKTLSKNDAVVVLETNDNGWWAVDSGETQGLKMSVNSTSDVVVKLMQIDNKVDICVRTAYIESGEVLVLKNIPEEKYYLKIAYGNDWRHKKVGKKCTGSFVEGAVYEIDKERLSFKSVQLSNRLDIPSYSLSLDGKAKQADATFTTTFISEADFNK